MALTASPKEKPNTSEKPRVLTQSEITALRQEMKQSIAWAQAELRRRHKYPN